MLAFVYSGSNPPVERVGCTGPIRAKLLWQHPKGCIEAVWQSHFYLWLPPTRGQFLCLRTLATRKRVYELLEAELVTGFLILFYYHIWDTTSILNLSFPHLLTLYTLKNANTKALQ